MSKLSDKLKSLIGKVAPFAPVIAGALGGPGAAAGVAALSNVLLGHDKGGEGEVLAALSGASPETLLKLKEADQAFEVEQQRIESAERADARARDVEIRKTSGGHNWRADVLAALAVGGLVSCVYFIAADSTLPERAVNAIMFIAGQLANAVLMVYAFEFGSSRGSKEKDAALSRAFK